MFANACHFILNQRVSFPNFTHDSRLLLIAPHPDDESLACSVILQRAVRAGTRVGVIYATDGEDNPWPQRFLYGKWRLNADDRARWGKIRRLEAIAALRELGVSAGSVRFLGLPDQKLTKLLLRARQPTVDCLTREIEKWNPTDLLVPSIFDTHPDHNALAVLSHCVLNELFEHGKGLSAWSYVVHGRRAAIFDQAVEIRASKGDTLIKFNAIGCHKTQLSLSKKRFLAYGHRPERFWNMSRSGNIPLGGSIRGISREAGLLCVKFAFSSWGLAHPTLLICGYDKLENPLSGIVQLPARSSTVELLNCGDMKCIGVGQYHGHRFQGTLRVPIDAFSAAKELFVKLERHTWFFDEAGWVAVASCYPKNLEQSDRSIERLVAIR